MARDSENLEIAVAKMRKAGWRITEQRKSLYSILLEKSEPMSSKDILAVHKKIYSGKSMDLVTIYRIMDKFQEIGLIHKVGQGGKYVVCEHLDCKSSFHLIELCKSCGSAEEKHVPTKLISPLFDYVNKKHKFLSASHSFCIEGYCLSCQ
ncbi:MAG: hypothetical protein CMP10_18660 [Zetaproteobacteria bacterium]|nr:hypothetical protein [Pseudobdellovibrionaceae bacterium]|tara:strand:+ start:610 stop:1059 length:450 start_codon:yes stop_codon:yes gene_type:complete